MQISFARFPGIIAAGLLAIIIFVGAQQPASQPQDQSTKAAESESVSSGTKPRAAADAYQIHTQIPDFAIGATLLTPDDVNHEFTSNLNGCCLVVEIGIYPAEGKSLEIARKNFVLHVSGTKKAEPAANPDVLAVGYNLSPPRGSMTPHGSVGAMVGTGGGYYPGPGQSQPGPPGPGQPPSGRTVDTSAEIGVGTPGAPSPPTELDRELMALELNKKGLPEGKISQPTAGYLYFVRAKKKKKDATHELECVLSGEKINLTLP